MEQRPQRASDALTAGAVMPRLSADRAPRHRRRTVTSRPIAESTRWVVRDTNTAKIRRSNEGNRLVIWLRLIPLPTIRSRDRARFGPLA